MRCYGGLPLVHQPGERWLYDTGSHILGAPIARASGKTLGAFLGERIFEPLGMKDTGFSVPEAKLDRLATCYWTAGGGLVVFDEAHGGRFASAPVFEAGSGGLVSTVDDYLAFCRMMLNKGAHRRERIPSRPSVEFMTTDHMTPAQKAASPFLRVLLGQPRLGLWSDSATTCPMFQAGSAGTGGYGTSAYSDPKEDMVGILMTHHVWDSPSAPAVLLDFWTSAYRRSTTELFAPYSAQQKRCSAPSRLDRQCSRA